MGTRADFYVGRGKNAEWIGSIAYDGYPDAIDKAILRAELENEYRTFINEFFKKRNDFTLPDDGWPWPWEDSGTTDYAYAFDGGKVWASSFGNEWFDPLGQEELEPKKNKAAKFPNMKDKQNVTLGRRSGLLVVGF